MCASTSEAFLIWSIFVMVPGQSGSCCLWLLCWKRKGCGGGGKLGKAGLAVQGSRGKSCHVQTCVVAGAVGSVPFGLSKDIPLSQHGLLKRGCSLSQCPDSVALGLRVWAGVWHLASRLWVFSSLLWIVLCSFWHLPGHENVAGSHVLVDSCLKAELVCFVFLFVSIS